MSIKKCTALVYLISAKKRKHLFICPVVKVKKMQLRPLSFMKLATLLHLKLQYLSNMLCTYAQIYVGILLKEEKAFYLILDGPSFHLFYCLWVFTSKIGKTPGRWWTVILLFCGLLLPSAVFCCVLHTGNFLS